ncbi:MAG: GNAT family N-acetyltransferase [Myxococcales bacterium FL481]|nr:MAG: GNAT family N-acetyltransferase [Myxococcales bacterium FL481]
MQALDRSRTLEWAFAAELTQHASESPSLAGARLCFGGVGSWHNQAVGLGFAGPASDRDLDELIQFYGERGVEPRAVLSPYADTSWMTGMAARGFTPRELENLLVFDLDRAPQPPGRPDPAGLEIVRVHAASPEVDTYIDASTSGFRGPDEPVSERFEAMARRTLSLPQCYCYLARVQGEAAGGGMFNRAGDVALFFGTSVRREFQRRGIQTRLLLHRLAIAKQLGCRLAAVVSSPLVGTEWNARRLGFELGYSRLTLALAGDGWEASP